MEMGVREALIKASIMGTEAEAWWTTARVVREKVNRMR